ncbi:MAG: glycosyltransferase, partial [Microbacterium sp.]|nr:glycosyltransferase [Microbacterium sp.]
FSGYSRLWSQILLHADQPTPRRVIWLHNEMASEVHRLVNGRPTMQRSLPAVFAQYHRYDALVSVSPALAAENAAHLAGPLGIPREKFVAARNLIDAGHVLDGLRASVLDAPEFTDAPSGARIIPSWAVRLDARAREGTRWFVTVGRLSPEKNQARLVRAFAAIADEHPAARLLIVGSGYLVSPLQQQVDALGLGDRAFLTGALSNPFAVLAAADCFVLSSDHEGQPMVLLEAAIARLPIVSVRFASVADALPERAMHVVAQSDEALADGLRAFLAGKVPPASLDVAAYNAEALEEAMRILLPPTPST